MCFVPHTWLTVSNMGKVTVITVRYFIFNFSLNCYKTPYYSLVKKMEMIEQRLHDLGYKVVYMYHCQWVKRVWCKIKVLNP